MWDKELEYNMIIINSFVVEITAMINSRSSKNTKKIKKKKECVNKQRHCHTLLLLLLHAVLWTRPALLLFFSSTAVHTSSSYFHHLFILKQPRPCHVILYCSFTRTGVYLSDRPRIAGRTLVYSVLGENGKSTQSIIHSRLVQKKETQHTTKK